MLGFEPLNSQLLEATDMSMAENLHFVSQRLKNG